MSQDRPASVAWAVWLTWALVVLSGVIAILSLVFKSELTDAWASGRVDSGSVKPPAIVPVVVVMLIVVALLAIVLLEFFRSRHSWARTWLTVTVVLLALSTVATLRIGPPTLFVLLSIVGLVLQAGVVGALWHRGTTAFLREPVAEPAGA